MYKVVITNCIRPQEYVTETLFQGTLEQCEEFSERMLENGFYTVIV